MGTRGSASLRWATCAFWIVVVSGFALPIAPLERSTTVDFAAEVLPFLRDNCLSCHSQTTRKGGLNLETPELMLKGGENGPAIVPGRALESLAMQAAAHLDEDLAMPPRGNKAKARDLSPEQLGLLKLWIDQGAKASAKVERVLDWQPLPDSVQAIVALAVTPDGQFAACARGDRISIYHLPSSRCIATEAAHRDQVNALAFSPDGGWLASGGYREVKLWRRPVEVDEAWKWERTIGTGDGKSLLADRVCALAFSRDGKQLATGGGEPSRGGEIKVFDPSTGELVRDFPNVHTDAVLCLEFSPNDEQLASGAADRMCRIVEVSTRKLVRTLEGHTEHVLGVSWSADGKTLATAGADHTIKLWDATTGERKKSIDGYEKEVTAVRFAGDKLLTSSGDNRVRLVGVDGKEVRTFPEVADFMNAVATTAEGRLVAAGGYDGVLRIWTLAEGKRVHVFAPQAK